MAELGILGMTTPPEYGGSGMDVVSWAIAQEEMARASVVVADIQLLSTLMQKMILQNGTEAQKAKHVPPLVSGEKIAIIGSGPAGMSCAYHLAKLRYNVTVFESSSSAGGMLRIGIPSYRLPKDVLDREISDIFG
jgi:NADPH-dependent 2,4-dienoyl-CoA reductase/sulfur reductase-like enzyme